MPLTPTRTEPVDERLEIRFVMRDGETLVDCFVDEGAIEDLDETDDEASLVERFARHRAMFESIASWLYDDGETDPRIELHHVAQFRER